MTPSRMANMAAERLTDGLSAAELAEKAGASEEDLERMVGFGILVPRDAEPPFLPSDVQKVRLATACARAGLPMEGIGWAIEQGRVSFTFLEATPFRRWGPALGPDLPGGVRGSRRTLRHHQGRSRGLRLRADGARRPDP